MKENIQNIDDMLYQNVIILIEESKKNALVYVNQTLVLMYRNIGEYIANNILANQKAEYGNEIIKKMGNKLTQQYGDGYGWRNLFRMIKVYECFADKKKLTTLSSKCSWSHFVEFVKIIDLTKREFYVTFCLHEHRSVRDLRSRINSQMFERTLISKEPQEVVLHELSNLSINNPIDNVSLFVRDPYVLDFLDMNDRYTEKDLESAILNELEKCILEFGSDFAFLARQKRISIGDSDYFVDLLFFHRKLKRIVIIELKLGEFAPEHKGQVELYLQYFKKYEKQEGENDPIAIVLCSRKDIEVIELMDLHTGDIHISEYWLELPPKEILQQKLHKAIIYAQSRI